MNFPGMTCFNIISKNYQEVVDLIVQNLEKVEEDDEEKFDSSTIDLSQISAICISKLTKILQAELLTPISQYAFSKLENQQTWKDKYCAFLALGAVLIEFIS